MPRRRRRSSSRDESPQRDSDFAREGLGNDVKLGKMDTTKQQRTTPVAVALGDVAKLQLQIAEERSKLQLFAINAKQDRDVEDFKHEYCKAYFDEPCGPSNRYLLKGELGRGIFATVFRCADKTDGSEYAVKMVRANPMARKNAQKEIAILRRLRDRASDDVEGAQCILHLAGCESFEHVGHMAIVFALMKCDLRTGLTKYGQGRGLPLLPTVRNFARSIFLALRFLSMLEVIHADLKPDNVLISMDKMSVKLCDFGCAMQMIDRAHSDYVVPRYYRPPEIIVGQSYNQSVDMWSAGTTLFEAATDRMLFNGETNNDIIGEMLRTCGAFPAQMTGCGGFVEKHFTKEGDFIRAKTSSSSRCVIPMAQFVKPSRPILQLLEERLLNSYQASASLASGLHHFAELLSGCLTVDPDARMTPDVALQHTFFSQSSNLQEGDR